MESILNSELADFNLLDSDNNVCVHDRNLMAFTELLNDNCPALNASIRCCGCVKTFPSMSVISLELDSSGVNVKRVLDLLTPDESGVPLSYGGIHF